jgi:hypothetical protein
MKLQRIFIDPSEFLEGESEAKAEETLTCCI